MHINGRKLAKMLKGKELGVFITLFVVGIAFILCAAFPLIQGSPTLDDLQRVYGTVEEVKIDRGSGWGRGWDHYHITLDVNGQEKVYSLSQFYRPDRTGAIEKLTPGNLIQLYLEEISEIWKENTWVDGSVYGIYDQYGNPIHPIEASWREREKNCSFSLWFGIVMEVLCGVCIWLLVRRPKWAARMNEWSESVPERRYIELGRRKRK